MPYIDGKQNEQREVIVKIWDKICHDRCLKTYREFVHFIREYAPRQNENGWLYKIIEYIKPGCFNTWSSCNSNILTFTHQSISKSNENEFQTKSDSIRNEFFSSAFSVCRLFKKLCKKCVVFVCTSPMSIVWNY